MDHKHFMNNPNEWKISHGVISICPIKKYEKPESFPKCATLTYNFSTKTYKFIDCPIFTFPKEIPNQYDTTVDEIINDGWIVD